MSKEKKVKYRKTEADFNGLGRCDKVQGKVA